MSTKAYIVTIEVIPSSMEPLLDERIMGRIRTSAEFRTTIHDFAKATLKEMGLHPTDIAVGIDQVESGKKVI